MSDSKVVTVREDHAARKLAEVASVAKVARMAKKELDSAAGALDKSLVSVAARYYRAGALVNGSTLSVRGFAIVAEYGDRDTFAATGLAQPRSLSSYRRADIIFAACEAVGADVAEVAQTYVMDAREAQAEGVKIEPTVIGFAEYCEAGFSLPIAKDARKGGAPAHFLVRAGKLAIGLTAAELAEVAELFASIAADAATAEALAATAKPVKVAKSVKVAA